MINHLVDPAELSTEVMSQLPLPVLVPIHLNCGDEGDRRPEEERCLKSKGDWRVQSNGIVDVFLQATIALWVS